MRNVLFSKKLLFGSLLIATIYVIIAVYAMNSTLVVSTWLSSTPLDYKVRLMMALLGGLFTAMTMVGSVTLILTGLLTGINGMLMAKTVLAGRSDRKATFTASGGSFVGIIAGGCAACGLPIISFFGLSASVAYLPLRGSELSYGAIALLMTSAYFLVRQQTRKSCEYKQKHVPYITLIRFKRNYL